MQLRAHSGGSPDGWPPFRATAVESSSGTGVIPTRGRSSRSASQQTPTVGSLDTFPSACSKQAWWRRSSCPSVTPSSPSSCSATANAAARGPCSGSRASFSRIVSCRSAKRKTTRVSTARARPPASQSPFAPTVRQCSSPWICEPMPVLRARTAASSGSSASGAPVTGSLSTAAGSAAPAAPGARRRR